MNLSFDVQVRELKPGDICSKVRPVIPSTPVADLAAEMPKMRRQLRSTCMTAVTRAKKLTNAAYSVEVGDVVMPGGSMYVVAVVSRNS